MVKVLLLVRIPGNIRTTSSYNSIDLVKLTLPLTGTDKARCEWWLSSRERERENKIHSQLWTVICHIRSMMVNIFFFAFGFC